jgi:glycosyltransferase involved in cell wall biosynthesis
MEILVVDDCSDRDDPRQVVDALGRGRVGLLRQTANVGKVRNYESGLQTSRGHLIHQLHGDDRVVDGFYRAMETAFARFPTAGAFFCESDYIDESGRVTGRTGRESEQTGILMDWLPRIAAAQRIQTPAMVVRREVYETLGGFDRRLDCSEDWEMWIRIANRFPVGFCAEARAQYRYSTNNNSARSILNGTRAAVQRRMFEIVDAYLPVEVVGAVSRTRAREQALFFANQLPKVMRANGLRGWGQLCRQVLSFSCEPFVIRRLISFTLRVLLGRR